MTKDEMIQEMIEITAHNMDWFIGIIGVTVAIFAVFQWRFTDKQIQNMKFQVLRKVNDTYESRIEYLEETIKEHRQYQNDHALQVANSLNDKFFELTIAKDIGQQSVKQNDIILTIESIINNDMIDEKMKVFAMKFAEGNINNCSRNGFKKVVDPIYKRIMGSEKLKPYYEASQQLFNSSMDSASDKK